MALGVRVLYPTGVTFVATSAGFVDRGARFVVVSPADSAGAVTIRIRAKSYDNFGEATESPSLLHPITQIDISNTSIFSAGNYLRLPYSENVECDVTGNTSYVTPTYSTTPIVDADASLDIVRVVGWALDAGRATKTVYVRFVTDTAIFPDPTDVVKGYSDDIIVVSEGPSLPQTLRVENESDNHYVPAETQLSWQQSQDNMAGLRGYGLNYQQEGLHRIHEECSSLDDFNPTSVATASHNLAVGTPVLWASQSTGFAIGECTFTVATGSKLRADFVNSSSDLRAHEIMFENRVGGVDPTNAYVEMKCAPSLGSTGSSSFYVSLQNFGPAYKNARSLNDLPATLWVLSSGAESVVWSLPSLISVLPIDVPVSANNSLNNLPVVLTVEPTRVNTPIYEDTATIHTAINGLGKLWPDYLLLEFNQDQTYAMVRPTRDLITGNLTGYTRTSLSTAGTTFDFSGELTFGVSYHENRWDTREISANDFGWSEEIAIRNTSRTWASPTQTILWQKFRATKTNATLNRIKMKFDTVVSNVQYCWFSAVIVPAGIDGLPSYVDSPLGSSVINNTLGMQTNATTLLWKSCTWFDGNAAPNYDPTKQRISSEVVWLCPGETTVSFAPEGFTAVAPANHTLTPGLDYYIGVTCVRLVAESDFSNPASTAGVIVSQSRPEINWMTLDIPLESTLPERTVAVRSQSVSSPLERVTEYRTLNDPTLSTQFKFYSSGNTLTHSTMIEDLATDAELAVEVSKAGVDGSTLLTLQTGLSRLILSDGLRSVVGLRGKDLVANISQTYDRLILADDSVVHRIDLSDQVGYDDVLVAENTEETSSIVDQTSWSNSDWDTIWTRRYGTVGGIGVGLGPPATDSTPPHDLYFSVDPTVYDGIDRYGEAHFLTPSGGSSFDASFRVDIDAYSLDSEFYLAILPSQYETVIGEIGLVGPNDPADFLLVGFRHTGDIYLYRPRVTDGLVQNELIYSAGNDQDYDWSSDDVRVRITNGTTPGVSGLSIWHGSNLLYSTDTLIAYLPESSRGFWFALGFHHQRGSTTPAALDVGNFVFKYTDPVDPDTNQSLIYYEYFNDITQTYFTFQGIEKLHDLGGDESWYSAGITNANDTQLSTEPHRIATPYNALIMRTTDSTTPDELTLDLWGNPNHSRMKLIAGTDDILAPVFTTSNRWFGPYMISNRGVSVTDFTKAVRWDMFYQLYFQEYTGDDEVYFGVAGMMPSETLALPAGITSWQEHPVYNFGETDYVENTKAQVYAMVSGNKTLVGVQSDQYGPARYPQFGYISFSSDGNAYSTVGGLTNGAAASAVPVTALLGTINLPYRGLLSVIIKPSTGTTTPVSVSLSATPSGTISPGTSVKLTWVSTSNAISVVMTGTNATNIPGATTVTNTVGIYVHPLATTEYTITVRDAVGLQATSSIVVNVGAVAEPPTFLSFVADSPNVPTTIRWQTLNATTVVATNLPGVTSSNLPNGNVSVTTAGTYMMTISNASGQQTSASVSVTSTVGGLSVGDPQVMTSEEHSTVATGASALSAGPTVLSVPQYYDLQILVNDTILVTKEAVPFNFSTTDKMHFFCGVRKRMPGTKFNVSATISHFALTYVNPRVLNEKLGYDYWTKTDGVLNDGTLIYVRNVDQVQHREATSDLTSMIVGGLISQTFIPTEAELRGLTVRTNATNTSYVAAYISGTDANGKPLLTPSSGTSTILGTEADILATAWGRTKPDMKDIFFTFPDSVPLTPGTKYAITLVNFTTVYGAPSQEDMPECDAYTWDVTNNVWLPMSAIIAFRTSRDVWMNRRNTVHGIGQDFSVAAVNHAGLWSDESASPTRVTVDLLPPHDPSDPTKVPVLGLVGEPTATYYSNSGRLIHFKLAAADIDVIGSGVWEYRLIYEGEFGELIETAYARFIDEDANGEIEFDLIYDGLFLDGKGFQAEVRDRVGNVSRTERIVIDLGYGFIEDTEPPYLVRVRIEGDASIDPDPNEPVATNKTDVNVGLYALDRTTGPMDYGVNANYEEQGGQLVYGDWHPYLPHFPLTLTGSDGTYIVSVKVRDYGDNATQPVMSQVKRVDFASTATVRTMPTTLGTYVLAGVTNLYEGCTRRTARPDLECRERTVSGHAAHTVYEPWVGNSRQTFKATETLLVKVNAVIVTAYTRDDDNDWVVFATPLTISDVVTMDIVEEVAVLFRYDGNHRTLIKVFDREGEHGISALCEFNGLLYIGTDSGRLYTHNGVKTSLSVYRTTAVDEITFVPVSCMRVCQFEADEVPFLYVGTYDAAQLFRYGGNAANAELNWTRVTVVTDETVADEAILCLEMYSDIMFIGTGPKGKVYRYTRRLSGGSVVEAITNSQLYSDEFTSDPSFTLNVRCLRMWNNKVFAGVDYNSSVFVYQYLSEQQPKDRDWTVQYDFNDTFLSSPLPWEFYSEGVASAASSHNVSVTETVDPTTGELTDWYMTMIGNASETCVWVDRTTSANSKWKNVVNATGWTLDLDLRVSGATGAHQDVFFCDGTYEMTIQIATNAVWIRSGGQSASVACTGTNWHRYRLTVHGKDVAIYADWNDKPIIDEPDFLEAESTSRFIMFGKTNDESPACNADWRRFYLYTSAPLLPMSTVEQDFVRDQVLPFGAQVRYLEPASEGLVAGVQPRDPSTFTFSDDPSVLIPRTFLRAVGQKATWTTDTTYPSDVSSLLSALPWNGKVHSVVERVADLFTNTPLDPLVFFTEDPHTPLTKDGRLYVRRLTQAHDDILKDTLPPDGTIIINEDTAAGSQQVYALETYAAATQFVGGTVIAKSATGDDVDFANQVIDGSISTYYAIGTNEVRYIEHDFGGEISVSKFKWIVRSVKDKTYAIEYRNTTDVWVRLFEGVSQDDGRTKEPEYDFETATQARGLRIYYLGDYQTITNDVVLTVSVSDKGIGTSGLMYSAYRDLRDATSRPDADPVTGWVPASDGTSTLAWNLVSDIAEWSTPLATNRPITAGVVFNEALVLGCRDGKVYTSSDGSTLSASIFTAGGKVNCFAEWRGVLYMGVDDGMIYESDDGVYWTTTIDTAETRVLSLAVLNDVLYIGTGDTAKVSSWNGSTLSPVKVFPAATVDRIFTPSDTATSTLVVLGPTGQIFAFDGAAFTQVYDMDSTVTHDMITYSGDGYTYVATDRGRVYRDAANVWDRYLDTALAAITGLLSFTNDGPAITRITEDGVGHLEAGSWRYLITYVDHAGVESGPGEITVYENFTNDGRLLIEWQTIENARGYRVYRSQVVNGAIGTERLVDPGQPGMTNHETTLTYLYDDGTLLQTTDAPPQTTSINQLWLAGDSDIVYVQEGQGLSQISLPAGATGANGLVSFRGQVYVFGQTRAYTQSEINTVLPNLAGKLIKYVGIGVGSGTKALYYKFKDAIDNETGVGEATTLYNNLIRDHVLQTDAAGTIVDSLESKSDPQQKLYAANKIIEQVGVYESQAFYAANISRWDTVDLLDDLPTDTSVKLYVRTAATRAALLVTNWSEPFVYIGAGSGITTDTADIDNYSGSWFQYKLDFITSERGATPIVYAVTVNYVSTNASYFFTNVFDLDAIANAEKPQVAGIKISRGLITWNGAVPTAGEVRFGISTADTETREWGDYQEVTPDRVFTVTPGGKFKIGILLVSTDTASAIVDDFSIMFESGDRDVKINLDDY